MPMLSNQFIFLMTGLSCVHKRGNGLVSFHSPLVNSWSSTPAPFGDPIGAIKEPKLRDWRRARTMALPLGYESQDHISSPLSKGVLASEAKTTKPAGYEGEFSKRRRNDDEEGLQEFNMNVGRVIDTLRRDYPRIFFEPLDYDIYSPDLELRDPLMIYDVSTSIRISYDASRQQVRVSWSFVLHMRAATRPLHVDGISIYSLNVRGKVRKHVVEIIIVNGEPAKPPFAKAWINLPSWLAEGLKGGATVPGLTASKGLSVDTGDLASSVSACNAPQGPELRESPAHQWPSASGRFELPADRAVTEGAADGRGGNELTRNDLRENHDVAPPDESWGTGIQGQVEPSSNEQGQRQKSIKKKGFWPITDIPGGCETSWDCEANKVCCDLLLVKVCCTNGVMQPRGSELIPLLTPIPGRRRDELDR